MQSSQKRGAGNILLTTATPNGGPSFRGSPHRKNIGIPLLCKSGIHVRLKNQRRTGGYFGDNQPYWGGRERETRKLLPTSNLSSVTGQDEHLGEIKKRTYQELLKGELGSKPETSDRAQINTRSLLNQRNRWNP